MVDEISESDIRQKLGKHYGGDNAHRNLIRNIRRDGNGGIGSVVYSLEGTPPKGYGIYIPGIRRLSLYDNKGERFRDMREVRVTEVEELEDATDGSVGGFFRSRINTELIVPYILQEGGLICDLCDLPETENTAVEVREITVNGTPYSPALCSECHQKVKDMIA